ncbi:MAG TPA: HlyD family secretion protein [Steroidobacteraceae bacterium]|jgi:membrane fusion protein (multidrug efflux system)
MTNGEEQRGRDGGAQAAGNAEEGKAAGARKAGMDPRKRRRFVIIALIVIVVVAVAAVVWWLHSRKYQSTDDAYIDAHIARISPQIAGRVLHVLVNDDARVEAGQLLVEIDPTDAQSRLAQAMAHASEAEAQLAQAQADLHVRQANYEQARASARGAAAQASNAQQDLERYRSLQSKMPEAVATQQLDQARTAAVNAAAQYESVDKQIGAAAAQVRAAETAVTGAQAALKNVQSQVQQAQINLGYTRVLAPEDGTVADLNVAVGNAVAPGSEMLAVVPFTLWVTANFKETQLALMRPGQPVDIKVDAFPDVAFHGHVDSIQRGAGQAFAVLPAQNATGNFVKVVQRVPVKIIIDGPQQWLMRLGPGMSVMPRVHVRP